MTIAKMVQGYRRNNKPWISTVSCKEIDERKKLKKIDDAKSESGCWKNTKRKIRWQRDPWEKMKKRKKQKVPLTKET